MSALSRVIARTMRLPPAIDTRLTIDRDVPAAMDDGIELVADIYTPGGVGPHPTILVRSPYGRRGPFGALMGRVFAERGYRVMMQSCRGTFGSGGIFDPNFNERADGLATVRWIEKQPWFDGRLAMNGPSYLAGVQWAIADDAGPSLRALCNHVGYSDLTRHWFKGGSLSLEDAIGWTTMVSEQETLRFGAIKTALDTHWRRIDRVINHVPILELDTEYGAHKVPYWRDIVEHPAADDPFWAPIRHSARVPKVDAAVLQVGGWYDIFLPGQLDDYCALVAAGKQPRLVVGPWTHTSPGGFAVQVQESLHWLDRHLREPAPATATDEALPVRLFVMGTGEWRDFSAWPPPGYDATPYHLHRFGVLDPRPPQRSAPDRYRYDPTDPTPTTGGTLLRRGGGRRDQTRTEARRDVLVYTTSVLSRDVEVVGNVRADVYVSSDVEHFDVYVRLCDVDPRGRSYNVCDGIQRVSPPRPTRQADGTWRVEVEMWPTAHRFLAGHRIRAQVSSGAHPRFARNFGTGDPPATATSMRVANLAIHHDAEHPTAVVLPVASGA